MDNDIDDGAADAGLAAELSLLSDDELTVGFDEALAASRHEQWTRLVYEAEIDRRRLYATDGTNSLREWISLRAGEGDQAAHHQAVMARHLKSFPLLAAALAEGCISAEHLRALLTLGRLTDATDAQLVDLGERSTVTELQTACRSARHLHQRSDNQAHQRRRLRWRTDDNGTLHLHGRLHGADGLTVTTALSAIAQKASLDPATGLHDPFDTRCADALVEVCAGPERARPEVVIHVPVAALTIHPDDADPDAGDTRYPDSDHPGGQDVGAPGGVGTSWDGTPISEAALRRLLCDSGLRLTLDDAEGRAVGIGRRSRAIPAWLESQLRWRDGGCRFPGCEHTHWLHGHHLVHWPDGGRTDLSNLAVLCGAHHRYLHEGGWRLTGDPDGELTFTSPTGRAYTSHPAHRPHGRPRRRHPPNTRSGPAAPGGP